MKRMLSALALVAGVASAADPAVQSEVTALQGQLGFIQQQQQSVFQEFLMIQELRRLSLQADSRAIGYDERLREKQDREERANQLGNDLNERYRRYQQLEEQKGPLVQRINELTAPR